MGCIPRVDPHRVVIHVLALQAQGCPGFAAVARDLGNGFHRIDLVHVDGIAINFIVVLTLGGVRAHFAPRLAAVAGAEKAAFVLGRFDDGVNHIGIDRGNGQADAAHIDRGQARGDLAPGRAAVSSFVNGRFRPAADLGENMAPALFGRSDDQFGIARIHDHAVNAGILADIENFFPVQAAVGGLVQAAIAARAPG